MQPRDFARRRISRLLGAHPISRLWLLLYTIIRKHRIFRPEFDTERKRRTTQNTKKPMEYTAWHYLVGACFFVCNFSFYPTQVPTAPMIQRTARRPGMEIFDSDFFSEREIEEAGFPGFPSGSAIIHFSAKLWFTPFWGKLYSETSRHFYMYFLQGPKVSIRLAIWRVSKEDRKNDAAESHPASTKMQQYGKATNPGSLPGCCTPLARIYPAPTCQGSGVCRQCPVVRLPLRSLYP